MLISHLLRFYKQNRRLCRGFFVMDRSCNFKTSFRDEHTVFVFLNFSVWRSFRCGFHSVYMRTRCNWEVANSVAFMIILSTRIRVRLPHYVRTRERIENVSKGFGGCPSKISWPMFWKRCFEEAKQRAFFWEEALTAAARTPCLRQLPPMFFITPS